MKYIADLHIHSHFSIATSKLLVPEYLDYWAKIKGITVVGTGDFTHPGWVAELKEKLEPAEPGLFKLKDSYTIYNSDLQNQEIEHSMVRFILSSEISSIYKKNGKTRKVHNVILAPDFETVEKIQHSLTGIGGNITSDGRPILGLDSRNLLEIALEASEEIFFIPAHIWTPWFSALGAKSGFDSIAECYDDLARHIYAVETGLSSDPAMNWTCSSLDNYALISNSDAHSPEKLGREANIFNTDLSYYALTDALKGGDPDLCLGTIEFFPQEGKYHYDGHRKCNIVWNPVESLSHGNLCPVCEKEVTIGVMNRVLQLSDRKDITERKNRHPFYSTVPLKELLSEIHGGVGPNSKRINREYFSLINNYGTEFDILLHLSTEEIAQQGEPLVAEAVCRMRNREVLIQEGYDGEFGVIRVFDKGDLDSFSSQSTLFTDDITSGSRDSNKRELINFDLSEYRRLRAIEVDEKKEQISSKQNNPSKKEKTILDGLNDNQLKAAQHGQGPALVLAGPGTGKTRVLTCRIAHLIKSKSVNPKNILAVTFTNKAASEMKRRIDDVLKNAKKLSHLTISTFHAFGLSLLKEKCRLIDRTWPFSLIDNETKQTLITSLCENNKGLTEVALKEITHMKQHLQMVDSIKDPSVQSVVLRYEETIQKENILDLDDLIYQSARLLKESPEVREEYLNRYTWIMIDEYQDINYAQYHLIRQLVQDTQNNICVIGDPNQAIYGFRGADVSFINTFTKDFPKAITYRLEKSYRCTQRIVKASGQIIKSQSMEQQFLKGTGRGIEIIIAPSHTDKSEAEYIARSIEAMMGGLRFFSMDSNITEGNRTQGVESLSDIAVLCRISRQMPAIEKAFFDHSIPFQTVGDLPFQKKEPIKSIVSLLKTSHNKEDTFFTKILSKGNADLYSKFAPIKAKIKRMKSVSDKIKEIQRICFPNASKENTVLIEDLISRSQSFETSCEDFLNHLELGNSVDSYRPHLEQVTLMTIHAAKGLEFSTVFIAGCEEGLIPYTLFKSQRSNIDEEKRLLYVGMTRAKTNLYLTYAKSRILFGQEHALKKSSFLESIEQELIKLEESKYKRKKAATEVQLNLFD